MVSRIEVFLETRQLCREHADLHSHPIRGRQLDDKSVFKCIDQHIPVTGLSC